MDRVTRESEMRRASSAMRHLLLAFKSRMDERLRDHKATAAQVRLLHELRANPGISGAQLARQCHITPQTAQAMLVRSVKAGWVLRGTDRENGRLVTARLTPEGERLLAHGEEIASEVEVEVWAGVTVAELEVLSELVERALGNLERG